MLTADLRRQPSSPGLREAPRASNLPMTATLLMVDAITLLAALGAANALVRDMSAFACAPLMALIALAIKIDSRGPVFFRQERAGH